MLSISDGKGEKVYGLAGTHGVTDQTELLHSLWLYGIPIYTKILGHVTDSQKNDLIAEIHSDIMDRTRVEYQLQGDREKNISYNCISWVLKVLTETGLNAFVETYQSLTNTGIGYDPIPAMCNFKNGAEGSKIVLSNDIES